VKHAARPREVSPSSRHDLNLAAAYADEIVLMSRGRIRASGGPAEVLRDDLLSEV
jgi:iron complex transport system ATP-binding protein